MKIIRFFSSRNPQSIGQPQPIKNFLPEWYRKAETTFLKDGVEQPGLKKCAPYLDAMISGYALVTPTDIFISENTDGSLNISWNGTDVTADFIAERPKESGSTMPRPENHYPNHLVFTGLWGVKSPRGWSLLFTHPLNRDDLPFTTLSGIIDADKFSASGNIPFFVKKGFVGVIPEGTPIVQIIPIKRSRWSMIKNDKGLWDLEHVQGETVRNPETSYKKKNWIKKVYN